MLSNNQAIQIDSRLLPDKESAVHDFEENGGHLTTFSVYGEDPLEGSPYLVAQREMEFHRRYPDFRNFFYTVANGNFVLFREGILYLIAISSNLLTQL